MRYPTLFAAITVCVSMLVNAVEAKPPKGKPSHGRSHKAEKHRHDKFHHKQRNRHEKFHDKQRKRHDKFHDKQRAHHNDHDRDGRHPNNRHDKFHDKQQNRHEKLHDKQRKRHDKFHDKQRNRHEGFHDKHGEHKRRAHDGDDRQGFNDSDRTGDHPWDRQRLNEDRKLQHRLDQAEHLRQIGQRNGNPRLAEVADRMEQQALEHYDKRQRRIDEHQDPVHDTADRLAEQDPPRGRTDQRRTDQARTRPTASPTETERLSRFNDRFQRRLLNERRELQHRLDTADRLRQLAERDGNQGLLQAADRVEGAALERFDRRISRFDDTLTQAQKAQLDNFFQRSVAGGLQH